MKDIYYIEIDNHNPVKGHCIKITPEGKIYYNQALKFEEHPKPEYREKHRQCHEREYETYGVPGWNDWVLFYPEWEEVQSRLQCNPLKFKHGYQDHIDAAYRKWTISGRPLEVDECFDHYFNQADREVWILAVTETEALGWYEMPRGRKFLAIFARQGADSNGARQWKRTQAVKTLPKYWKALLPDCELKFINEEVG